MTYNTSYWLFLLLKQSLNGCDLESKSTYYVLNYEAVFFCATGHSPLGNSAISHLWEIPLRLRTTVLDPALSTTNL